MQTNIIYNIPHSSILLHMSDKTTLNTPKYSPSPYTRRRRGTSYTEEWICLPQHSKSQIHNDEWRTLILPFRRLLSYLRYKDLSNMPKLQKPFYNYSTRNQHCLMGSQIWYRAFSSVRPWQYYLRGIGKILLVTVMDKFRRSDPMWDERTSWALEAILSDDRFKTRRDI